MNGYIVETFRDAPMRARAWFERLDCTLTAPITGELPAPATPSTPEEIVARSKWLHVVLTQEPEQPWQIACESDEKKDAIATFNAAWKAAKKSGGRVLRFEHKTLKREYPTQKEHAEEPQRLAAN